jgi:hypothetical protein
MIEWPGAELPAVLEKLQRAALSPAPGAGSRPR